MTQDPEISHATLSALQTLCEVCQQMEADFRSAAQQSQAQDVRALLRRRAEESRTAATELQAHVHRLNKRAPRELQPEDRSGALWLAARSTLASHTDQALLELCERQEDAALESYSEALALELEPAAREVLQQQKMQMRSQHELLRAMRDRLRGLSE